MLAYVDTSALYKLLAAEEHSAALHGFLEEAQLVSCSLVLTELPRAVQRKAGPDRTALQQMLVKAVALIDSVALIALDEPLLAFAGMLDSTSLRSLDAIHVAAAANASPVDVFVSYDRRQLEAAELAGLSCHSPGVAT